MPDNDTSGRALVDHWTWAAERGLMNKHTAHSLASASKTVLGVLDDWENVDLRTLNLDDVGRRFQNLRKKDYKPRSLNVYLSRFKRSVESYLDYVDNPSSWQYDEGRSAPKFSEKRGKQDSHITRPSSENVQKVDGGDLVDYPFPLRSDVMVHLVLPRDLNRSEVRRLEAFMTALAVDGSKGGDADA